MKFKKIISIIISTVITAASIVVFNSSPFNHNAFKTSAELDYDKTYDSWQEAYRDVLNDFMDGNIYKNMSADNLYYSFWAEDLNSDGIPELFLDSPQSTMPSYLYTFYNNKVKPLGGFIKGGEISYCKDENIILAQGGSAGYAYYQIYQLQNGELKIIEDLFSDTMKTYKRNDIEIAKSEYDSLIRYYQSKGFDTFYNNRILLNDTSLYTKIGDIYYDYYFDYYEAYCIDYDENSNIDISSISISNAINGLPVKKIGEYFLGVLEVKELNIPSNIEYLTDYSLNSYYLEKINVDASNKYYSSKDGVLYNKNMTTLVKFPIEKNASSYIFPNSVTRIGEDAFYNCNQISNITIPETVNTIEYSAFMNCENLKSITIKNPDCIIEDYDTAATICNSYIRSKKKGDYSGVIQGYDGSTAQKYAEKYDRIFTSLGANPKLTTTTTATTTTKKVTTTSTTTTRITTTTLPVRKINVTMWGDANVDGRINVADVICIRHMIEDMDMFIADGTLIFNKDQSRVNADVVSPQDITGATINPENVKITGADADRIINYIISSSFDMTKAVTPINT